MSAFDDSVGQMVDKLKEAGQYDNTIIIFTADVSCFYNSYP